jgi:citrate lyase subunit beta / citryl-CoA lyase
MWPERERIGVSAILATARSLLFVPGDRPERFHKAISSGADAVIIDLEDSVPPATKAVARTAIADAWSTLVASGKPVVIRTGGSVSWSQDLEFVRTLGGLAGLMLPKTETQEMLGAAHAALPQVGLLPLIETAWGWRGLEAISSAPGVLRLALGHIDFTADTGLQLGGDEAALAPLRFAMSMHSRIAGLFAPVDGVTIQLDDHSQLLADTARARQFGFSGKLCIHPRQIQAVHTGFAPTAQEVNWARRVLEADRLSQGAAVQIDGRMVDRPVTLLAQAMLQRCRTSP